MQGQTPRCGRHPSRKDFGVAGAARSCLLRGRLPDMIRSRSRAMYDVAASSGKLCRHLAPEDSMQAYHGVRPGLESSRNKERFLPSPAVVIEAKVFLQGRYRTCAQFAAGGL